MKSMKTYSRFKIEKHVRPALRLMAIEKGLDLDAMVNEILLEAIKGLASPKRIEFSEFMSWAGENLPQNEPILKNYWLKTLFFAFPGQEVFITPKLFYIWIEDYAVEARLHLKHGKSNDGRWVILSKKEIKPAEAKKTVCLDDFFRWGDKMRISSAKIVRKQVYNLFLNDHKDMNPVSQKVFFSWLPLYAIARGYSILNGGLGYGQWVMLLLPDKIVQPVISEIFEKDDFGY